MFSGWATFLGGPPCKQLNDMNERSRPLNSHESIPLQPLVTLQLNLCSPVEYTVTFYVVEFHVPMYYLLFLSPGNLLLPVPLQGRFGND